MSKKRAIAGALALPFTAAAKVALMAFTFAWVLVADIVPSDIETIIKDWRGEL